MVLFGREPRRHLPQHGVSAAAFPGTEKDYAAIERAVFEAPLFPRLDGAGAVVEAGLVEQCLAFVGRNTRVRAQLDGGRRIDAPELPTEALREAVVNALIHRYWLLSGTDVELNIYSDRLEVISPGRLPNGVTPERMRVGLRAARNPMLRDLMRDHGYLEAMGLGVPRKIVRRMREVVGLDPLLVEDRDAERFKVVLPRPPPTAGVESQ